MAVLESATILVVDDHPFNSQALSEYLKFHGADVAVAVDREEAMALSLEHPPDLILLDIMLPDCSGIELCKEIKSHDVLAGVPVIFTSALAHTDSKLQGFEAGGSDYVTKPYSLKEIVARVQTHLSLARQQALLQADNLRLQDLAEVDALTQISNRRRFERVFAQEWRRSQREQTPLSLLIFDLDEFKAYNDRLGHPAGDACLQQVAQAVQTCLKRPGDLLARLGGEEFAIILANTPIEGACFVAEHVLRSVRELKIQHPHSTVSEYVTLSLGLSCCIPGPGLSTESLLHEADQAMYEAKAEGRNGIRIYADPEIVHP